MYLTYNASIGMPFPPKPLNQNQVIAYNCQRDQTYSAPPQFLYLIAYMQYISDKKKTGSRSSKAKC